MVDVHSEERCVALTGAGARCSRIAKDRRFCFQHDESSPTVDEADQPSAEFVNLVAESTKWRPEQLSGVQKDIAQNIEDLLGETGSLANSFGSLNVSQSLEAFENTVGKTGPTVGKGALVGGVVGSPFGPIGIAAGCTAGAWFGVYQCYNDKRALAASIVDEPPAEATITPSDHVAIKDTQPVQMTIQSAVDGNPSRIEWLRSTLTRERDMDTVAEALDEIPEYRANTGVKQYYITDQQSGHHVVLQFGVPVEEQEPR